MMIQSSLIDYQLNLREKWQEVTLVDAVDISVKMIKAQMSEPAKGLCVDRTS
jgi:hypothetical protein